METLTWIVIIGFIVIILYIHNIDKNIATIARFLGEAGTRYEEILVDINRHIVGATDEIYDINVRQEKQAAERVDREVKASTPKKPAELSLDRKRKIS